LTRLGEERAEESWEYLSYQMELFPHAIVFMTAALVRFAQAAQTDDPKAKLDLWGNVVELCEKAWDQFNQLPAADIRNPAVRQLMTISLEAAALVSTQVGQHEEAKRLVDEAVRLSSTSYSAWGLRGIVYQPDPRCEEFFRKAMELGDPTYLAQVAMMRKGFDEALRWCDLALEKVPHPSIRAELFGWKAVARHCQGASESEVRALFGQGLAIQPENPNLRHNYSIFQKEIADRQPMAAVRVGQVGTVRFNDYLTWDESRTTTQRFVAEDIVRKTHNLPTQGFVANRRKRLEDQMSHAVGVSN
jgi:tetratricopeptide (TPR) repeat protein